MYTDDQIVNLGLAKIGQSRVTRLDAPVSPLERFVAPLYGHWKRYVLSRHKWAFARVNGYQLTLSDTIGGDTPRPYKFALPVDCIKPIRTRRNNWQQAGKFVYSSEKTLFIDYVKDVQEADFDTWFIEVLACKIALECVEYVTQSNMKKSDAKQLYDETVSLAKQENAFIVGPEDYAVDDYQFEFLRERFV